MKQMTTKLFTFQSTSYKSFIADRNAFLTPLKHCSAIKQNKTSNNLTCI